VTNSAPLRLVLVGGGHAHVHLLHEMARAPYPGTEVILVSPFPHHHYSGMVPGYLSGRYEAHELRFDLERAVRAVGGRLVVGWATGIELDDPHDPMGKGRVLVGDESIDFDLASLDVGSVPLGMDLPGAAALAGTVRPMSRAVALRDRLDLLISDAPRSSEIPIAVIGAGSAGFEVALALHRRIQLQGRIPHVLLVERGARILPDFSDAVRRRAEGVLARVGIEVRLGTAVRAVHPDGVELEGMGTGQGVRWETQLPVWMTGAAPPPFLATSDLPIAPTDGRAGAPGFFLVDETLRAVTGAPVWGAGDCIALQGAPWMGRAGVYAVRQSPFLEANLRGEVRRRQGLPALAPRPFRPQRSFLSLQNTADGRALLRWKGVVLHTRWAMTMKDRIDRAFMTKYTSS
jgi:NADH dehydrogenase FAD-containing subunit